MPKIKISVDEDNNPKWIEIDGKKIPIEAFFLTTAVQGKEAGHFLCFGNSDDVGRMIFSFWRWSVYESPEFAWTMEEVSKHIIEAAKEARGNNGYERDEPEPGTVH